MDDERAKRALRATHELYGNVGAMGDLADRLADLASIPSRVAKDVAADLAELVEDGYAEGTDAYGRPFAPLKKRTLLKHGPPPLTHLGIMREDTTVRAGRGAGVVLSAPFPAGIHMTGAGSPSPSDPQEQWGMEARPIFPDGDELPRAWQEAIDARVAAAFEGRRKR
jgi:hypothetical protein